MDNTASRRISAIIDKGETLEDIIEQAEKLVGRHDISVQGAPHQVAKAYGIEYINPAIVKDSNHPPKTEPFLHDDFGWVQGLSFGIPLFICIVVGVFIIGDVRSDYDNLFYGLLGLIVGGLLGGLCSYLVKRYWDNSIRIQENQGGFVLWIRVTGEEQTAGIMAVLNRHGVRDVTLETLEPVLSTK